MLAEERCDNAHSFHGEFSYLVVMLKWTDVSAMLFLDSDGCSSPAFLSFTNDRRYLGLACARLADVWRESRGATLLDPEADKQEQCSRIAGRLDLSYRNVEKERRVKCTRSIRSQPGPLG